MICSQGRGFIWQAIASQISGEGSQLKHGLITNEEIDMEVVMADNRANARPGQHYSTESSHCASSAPRHRLQLEHVYGYRGHDCYDNV